jgi:hypothetical protein
LFEARRINGFFTYADSLLVTRTEGTRRVDGGLVDTNFFAIGWLEARWVNCGLVDTNFLTIAWLELGSVLTLSHVELCIVLAAAWTVDFNFDLLVTAEEVRAAQVGEFDVNFVMSSADVKMCFTVSVIRSVQQHKSALKLNVGEVAMSTRLR